MVLATLDLDRALARSVKMRKKKGRLEVVGRVFAIGARTFPPTVKSVNVARLKRREFEARLRLAHLDFRAVPQELPKKLRQDNRVRRYLEVGPDMGLPTNIFSPDDRYTFSDTAFPWSTCGRVDTAAGWGSGVMIGPRHTMTASHVINALLKRVNGRVVSVTWSSGHY